MENETNIVEVAVLKQKVFDLKEIVLKLEEAIEKGNDINSNITKMLAVHDEKININEQNNHTIYEKIWELSTKIEDNKKAIDDKIQQKFDKIYNKISTINTKIIVIVSVFGFLGFIITNRVFFVGLLHQTLQPSPPQPALTNSH